MTAEWWRASVGYEVYLRSFADGDGDGVGDLPGLATRLDHLADLGVDVVWITPFYPSPMHDHGYDVADYTGIAPQFGSLADFDAVVARAHELGLRVVVDLVPNHTSFEHAWFRRARSSRADPYRDYYVWRDPKPDGGPPNNWLGMFGGPAWTLDDRTGQYYLHQFLAEQPDLNWDNPAVADEFDRILTFWLERGVDGFRIDVAHRLVKHPELPDNPPAPPEEQFSGSGRAAASQALAQVHNVDQPGVVDVYRRWRDVVEPYGALLLGEVYLRSAAAVARYVRGDGLHAAFWFEPLHIDWAPDDLRRVLATAAEAAPEGIAWIQGSHDRSRAATRLGGGATGRARSLAFATLLLGLPGLPFVYQGEELGLTDVDVPAELAQDPIARRGGDLAGSRDPARTPMPWAPEPGYGFTPSDVTPWLPFGDRGAGDTVAVQRGDPTSMLSRYRRLVRLRRATEDLHTAPLSWVHEDGSVLSYRRGEVLVVANCGERSEDHRLPSGRWRVAFDTAQPADAPEPLIDGPVRLAPAQALVLRSAAGSTPAGGGR